jgi:hypothetical protein
MVNIEFFGVCEVGRSVLSQLSLLFLEFRERWIYCTRVLAWELEFR